MNNRLKIGLICAVNFVAGLVLGAVVGILYLQPNQPPKAPRKRIMQQRLRLSDEQSNAVEAILVKYEPVFRRIKKDHTLRVSEVRDKIDAELKQILSNDQFRRLLEFRRELEAKESKQR